MKVANIIAALCIAFALVSCDRPFTNPLSGGSSSKIPHLEKNGTATRIVADGKPILMIAGELHNSTCGGFDYMRPVWKRMAKKNLNTVIATVSWELLEPEEGRYDFRLVDSLITGAGKADLKLVLIWFGSWKNASSVYIPSWVKRNYEKYPRAKDESGKPLEILSTFSQASRDADAKAFSELMRHIRKTDSKHSVLMMQVENEIGILDNQVSTPGNARRDFSAPANAAFNGPVPPQLMKYLSEHKNNLYARLYDVWEANGFKTEGTWEEVFGKGEFKSDPKDWQFMSYYTEELFSAWNYGQYVEKIAEAGKKEYPIPMYVNAWLKQVSTYWPGVYPSGGPLPQVIDIWRAAAPSIDFIAPDIYIDDFATVCKDYTRSGNPLFIPETRGGETAVARSLYVFGEFSADMFSPFGIDNAALAENDPLDQCYGVLNNMSPAILKNQGTGNMRGILLDQSAPEQQFELGDYNVKATMSWDPKRKMAGAILIKTGANEFIAAGKGVDLLFYPKDSTVRLGVEAADEGVFKNDEFVPERRLNGDETHASTWSGTAGIKLPWEKVNLQKLTLYRYK
jgi:hypothetical protein